MIQRNQSSIRKRFMALGDHPGCIAPNVELIRRAEFGYSGLERMKVVSVVFQ